MRIRPSIAVALGLSTLTLYSIVLPGLAEAATTVTPAPTPPATPTYTATAQSDVLHVSALGIAGLSLADAAVGEATGQVNSTQTNPGGSPAWHSKAYAGGLSVKLAGQGGAPVSALQTAPDPAAAGTTYGPSGDITQLAPLVTAKLADSSARAEWNDAASCGPLSLVPTTSTTTIANLTVIGGGIPGTAFTLPSLLELPATASATETIEQTDLPATAADDRGLKATAGGNVASVKLLGGAIQIHVDKQARLVVAANGTTATPATYSQPVLTVDVVNPVDGSVVSSQSLEPNGQPLELVDLPGLPAPLSSLLDVELSLGNLTQSSSATAASASAALVHAKITLLGALGSIPVLGNLVDGITVLEADVAPLSASVAVPAGGIACSTDPDGDGLSTDLEKTLHLDPYNPDTDGDGVADGAEDSDGDGLTNAEEIAGTKNTAFGTKPTAPGDADSDDDGYSDGAEVSAHPATDPNDPRSHPTSSTPDTTAPAAPVINPITPGADATPTITGTAEPGSTVAVSIDGKPVGTTVAGGNGAWTFTVPSGSALTAGDHRVTATATDAAENTSVPSAPVVASVIDVSTPDTTAPAAPVINPIAPSTDTTPTITGTAEPGSAVAVSIDGKPVGTVPAGPTGGWAYTVPNGSPLAVGDHRVTATATDAAENTSVPSAPVVATITASVPAGNDPDHDGLTNAQEKAHGTNPRKADTDGDGLSDGAEVKGFRIHSKLRLKGKAHGKVKKVVWVVRTNPLRADSDHDGLSDKAEITGAKSKKKFKGFAKRLPTNPVVADTDHDGLKDGQEILRYRTNPLNWDTDRGGMSDGREVKRGWSPLTKGSGKHRH